VASENVFQKPARYFVGVEVRQIVKRRGCQTFNAL
jgi:hypothetical protein